MNNSAIRSILRNAFGARKYRITASGEIHVFGVMPNTSQSGWYFLGWAGDTQTEAHIKTL